MAITQINSWNSHGTNNGSLTISPASIGNVVFFTINSGINNATGYSISGGGVAWDSTAIMQVNPIPGNQLQVMWKGVVTATGSAAITVTYVGVPGTDCDLLAVEWSGYTAWSVYSSGSNSGSGATVNYPSLTSPAGDAAYFGSAVVGVGASASGSTSGFTFLITTDTDAFCFSSNGSPLTPLTAYAPVQNQSSSGFGAMGAIFGPLLAGAPGRLAQTSNPVPFMSNVRI